LVLGRINRCVRLLFTSAMLVQFYSRCKPCGSAMVFVPAKFCDCLK
jgi:hypothetical protein